MLSADRVDKIIAILQSVLAGTTEPKSGLESWPDIAAETDLLIKEVWQELKQYDADAGIHAKDRNYAEYKKKSLDSALQMIKAKFALT